MHNKKYLKNRRQELRNNATSAEAFLWKYLSNSQLNNRKFRRQHSIENYIVDFYCPSEYLIIELDGEVHNNSIAEEKDAERDNHLKELGFNVLRFENRLVFDNLNGVLKTITENFKKSKSSPPSKGGEWIRLGGERGGSYPTPLSTQSEPPPLNLEGELFKMKWQKQ